MKKYISPIITLLLFIAIIFSCAREKSGTDLVKITGESEFMTPNDIKKGIQKTTNSISAVYLSHEQHEKAGSDCVVCHHKKNNPSRIKKCAYCHKGLQGARHLHDFCIGCHAKTGNGPEKCGQCHREDNDLAMSEFVSMQFDRKDLYTERFHPSHEKARIKCTACHHHDGDQPDRKKIKRCSQCHTGKSKMKILHTFCRDCHKKKARAPLTCKGCHTSMKKIDVDDVIILTKSGHRKKPIKFNHRAHVQEYNTECVDCHHKMKNTRCSDCHKRKDQGHVINLKGAFHQQCHDCHRRTKGPRACGRCHVDTRRR